MGQPGTYVLVAEVQSAQEITIGRLGTYVFPAGYYLYVGSAGGPGGLEARLARHLRQGKRLHWHVDYLLQQARVVDIWKAPSPRSTECLWARALLSLPGAQIVVDGFGASDCRCRSHLIHFRALPSFRDFLTRLQNLGVSGRPQREVIARPAKDDDVEGGPSQQR
jgi:Uri superfamily endonuclease